MKVDRNKFNLTMDIPTRTITVQYGNYVIARIHQTYEEEFGTVYEVVPEPNGMMRKDWVYLADIDPWQDDLFGAYDSFFSAVKAIEEKMPTYMKANFFKRLKE